MAYRILKIAPTSFFADNGCHVRILEEAQALRRLGHSVSLYTYHSGRNVAGLDIHRTVNIPWRKDIQVGSSLHRLYFDAFLTVDALVGTLRHRPHVVHAHLHEAALIGWIVRLLRGIPLVFDFQGSLCSEMLDHHFLKRQSLLYGPLRWLETRIDRGAASAILTSTSHGKRILVEEFGVREERIHTIQDCVNTEVFAPERCPSLAEGRQLRAALGIPDGRKVVVYLGLLAEYQGINVLLEAARRVVDAMPETHFLIMGYPGVETYRTIARALGIGEHTTFPGQTPYDLAPRYLALGDVAVSPKMSATEGQGKLVNYMAMGLPSVVFDSPVSRELLGEVGVYARYGDAESLASSLLGLLADEQRRRALGAQSRERAVRLFSWDGAARRIEEVYNAVVAARRHAFVPQPN